MDFVREATRQLDTLTSVFEEAQHLGATAKALQFAEVAGSAAATQKIVPPGAISGLYGEMASSNGFEIDVEPPQLATRDVQDQLDAIMEVEEAKRVCCIWFCCSGTFAFLLKSLVSSRCGCGLFEMVEGKLPCALFSCRRSLRPRSKH